MGRGSGTGLLSALKRKKPLGKDPAEQVQEWLENGYNRFGFGVKVKTSEVAGLWDALIDQASSPPTAKECELGSCIIEPWFTQGKFSGGDCEYISTQKLWPDAFSKITADGKFAAELNAAGLDGEYIQACLNRDPRGGIFESSPGLAELMFDREIEGEDIHTDGLREILVEKAEIDVQTRLQEVLDVFPKAKEYLESDENNGDDAVDAINILSAISPRHIAKPPIGDGDLVPLNSHVLNWNILRQDWQAWQLRQNESERGTLPELMTPYNSRDNSVNIISGALNVTEEQVIDAIEQVARVVENKS